MDFKQFIRVFVCIVLVCILLFNSSPLRAQALEPISTALGIGVAALLLLGTAGIVFNPTSNDQIEAIGNSMQTYLYQWGTSAEKLDDVDEFFGGLTLYEGSPDDDGDDDTPHERQFKILNAVKTGLAAWLISIASGSTKVEEDVEVAAQGYAYYNGVSLPMFDFSRDFYGFTLDYHVLYMNSDGSYCMVSCTKPMVKYLKDDGGLQIRTSSVTSNYAVSRLDSSSDLDWSYGTRFYSSTLKVTSLPSDYSFLWANHDFYDFNSNSLILPASEPVSSSPAYVEPSTYVGDIPDGIKDGSITEDNLELPDLIDYSKLAVNSGGLVNGVTTMLQNVHDGFLSYDELLATLQPAVSPEPDPEPATEPSEPVIPVPDLDDTPLSEVKANVFFDTLTDIITAPFKWIWEKLDTKLDTLKPPEFDFDRLTEIITAPFHWIWEKIETVILPAIRSIPDAISDLGTSLQTLGNSIIDKIAEVGAQTKAAIESLVVPDEDYLSDKIAALCEEFAFADSIVRTTQQLGNMLAGVTTEPPVIYIDLGSTRGSYDIGGVVPFLDLRWYAEYKPTVDAIISAFLWVCFIWRMFLKLPGIINGAAGDFVLIQSRREDYFNDR